VNNILSSLELFISLFLDLRLIVLFVIDLRTHLGLLSKAVELSEPRFTYRVLRCLTATKKKFQSPDSNQAEATLKLIIDIGLPSSQSHAIMKKNLFREA
jgi:hypothetical protein